ncbi:MAG: CPBP family intramembrane metalloprotease [Dehalococcoidales bacterium]|nr:CPBP family intramembrane metalloprotease [Dehalococcoidales bacterium]
MMKKFNRFVFFSFLYVFFFGIAEFISYHVSYIGGMVFYFILLLGLIIHGTLTKEEKKRRLLLALGLVPTIKIISMVMPTPEISQIYWYLLISVATLAGIVAVMRVLTYDLNDIGLNWNDTVLQILVAPAGFFLGAIGFLILKPEAMVYGLNLQMTLFPALVLLVSTGFIEEMAFRGVIQRAARVLGNWDWVYVSVIYAILQIGRGSLLFCLLVFMASLFFGWTVKQSNSIIGVSLGHGLFNIGLFLIYPFLM